MNTLLSEYTAFELSTLNEAIQDKIKDLERYVNAVKDNKDLTKLLSDEIAMKKKKLEALYTQRVQVLNVFESVKRREVFMSN